MNMNKNCLHCTALEGGGGDPGWESLQLATKSHTYHFVMYCLVQTRVAVVSPDIRNLAFKGSVSSRVTP